MPEGRRSLRRLLNRARELCAQTVRGQLREAVKSVDSAAKPPELNPSFVPDKLMTLDK